MPGLVRGIHVFRCNGVDGRDKCHNKTPRPEAGAFVFGFLSLAL